MEKRKNFWDKNARRYDRFMHKDAAAYHDLIDPSVSGFFRFLARVGDGMMNMQIVKIGFGKAV